MRVIDKFSLCQESTVCFVLEFLAHLRRKLKWAIVIAHRPSSVHPFVICKLFTFSTSLETLDGFWWNLVGMKCMKNKQRNSVYSVMVHAFLSDYLLIREVKAYLIGWKKILQFLTFYKQNTCQWLSKKERKCIIYKIEISVSPCKSLAWRKLL